MKYQLITTAGGLLLTFPAFASNTPWSTTGNIGIGTTAPCSVVNFTCLDTRGVTGSTVDLGTPTNRLGVFYSWSGGTAWGSVNSAPLVLQTADTERLRIDASGNIGIGMSTPTQKLSVAGAVRAKEVIVDTGWSDYVFDENYRLAPLVEIEAKIKADKHLPGIPSAKDVAEKGLSVGKIEAQLLAKIEEITLHQISQEKEINKLKAENA